MPRRACFPSVESSVKNILLVGGSLFCMREKPKRNERRYRDGIQLLNVYDILNEGFKSFLELAWEGLL